MDDYERYDFWHRETVQVKEEITMSRLADSGMCFDDSKKSKYQTEEVTDPEVNYINS